MSHVDPDVSLEILNGCVAIVGMALLASMGRYLLNEGRRRRLPLAAFLMGRLPPQMNFALAVFVFDAGITARALVLWAWRFVGDGGLSPMQWYLLIASAGAILVGGLCKVRAQTRLDYGHGPWLAVLAMVAIFIAGTIAFR